jgi:MFS family permease
MLVDSRREPLGGLRWIAGPLAARRGVVIGAFFALCVCPLAVTSQTVGLFVGPMTHEFGWSRTAYFLGPSIAGLACGLALSFIGLLGDRIGIRPILLVGSVIYGLALMSMGLLTGSIPAYVALCTAVYLSGLTQTALLFAKAISGWFSDRRGLMLSVAISGMGVGSILIPIFTSRLIERFGWRGAYVGLGATVMIIGLPAIFFLVQEPPRKPTPDLAGPIVIPDGLTLREALRTRSFWLLILLFTASNAALLSLVSNLAPVLTSHGVPLRTAALAMSALGVSQTLCRLASGYVLDRTSHARLAAVWYLLATGGGALLAFAHTPWAGVGAGLLIGTAWGAENELAAYFTSRYFGLRSYGLILGAFYSTFALGGMPVVLLTARIFDVTGTYDLALIVMAGCLVLSCVLAALLGPYEFSKTGVRRMRGHAAAA